ncbi:histidine phosphatase family protein [Nocardia sp. NBC_00565]|uniref:histidine phosphatase family protein n=1 Tax=Nocardia sp. NBC_00565 TaxID=2975993 RepID=UPI002E81932A|nr:histidine phosphatase family protein [Nocardia sp. NBC_00565]WUC03392.1 histidine phosphatase family protein [Nocardia sp. NBC_00565]
MAAPDWEIVIVRHGATEWSRTARFTGHIDIPLSARGRGQATELGLALRVRPPEIILSSDLRRARQTAETIARVVGIDPKQVRISTGLREEFLGCWQGRTRAEVARTSPDGYARWRTGDIGAFDGREGLIAVARRAVPVLLAHVAERPRSTGRLVVVTHANTALALAGSLTEIPPGRWTSLPCPAPAQAMVLC